MTDQTPATEVGRRHVRYLADAVMPRDAAVREVIAIEAEARAECERGHELRWMEQSYDDGRADALREAAERVRALEGIGLTQTSDRDPVTLRGTVSLVDVLTILDPER